jgi:N-methylhydantoinase B
LVPDSEGAGKFRGGRAGYWSRCLYGVDEASDLSFYIGKEVPALGFSGGENGTSSIIYIKRDTNVLSKIGIEIPLYEELDGTVEVLPQQPSALGLQIQKGEVVFVRGMGGGGYGCATERAKSAIEIDLEEGLLSPGRAKSVYGYNG